MLLGCGILSSALYVAMLVFVPMQWDGYSSASQTVSELSAIGAPTRALWVPLSVLWSFLYVAFGLGVWQSHGRGHGLRVAGALIIAQGVFGVFWPPLHLRGTEFTQTDALHIVWTMVNAVLTLLVMGFGAAARGKRFRLYTIVTVIILIGAGAMTGFDAPKIQADLPTPWVGVWERINIGAWLLWVLVLASTLLRHRGVETHE